MSTEQGGPSRYIPDSWKGREEEVSRQILSGQYKIVEGTGNPLPKVSPIGALQVELRRRRKTVQEIRQAADSCVEFSQQLRNQGTSWEDVDTQLIAFIATNYDLAPDWYE